MISTLLQRLLVTELSKYGRDGEGNIVISPQTLAEVALKITSTLHTSIQRPVITANQMDVLRLASRAGFKIIATRTNQVASQMLMDRTGAIDHMEVVTKLVDFTVQYVLEQVAAKTQVR